MKMMRTFALVIVVLLSGCSDFPRDPGSSLEQASGGTLEVGVSESYPWVIRNGDDAAGVEPELIRRFADSIDADIEWVWGSPEEHYAALEHYDIHIAATGATTASPWRKHLGFSQPYHTSRVIVAAPDSYGPVLEIEDRKVMVRGRGPNAGLVRDHDGIPVVSKVLKDVDGLAAIEDWELDDLDLRRTGIVLKKNEHVFAVPQGENALLMALENSAHGADITELIRDAVHRYERPDSHTVPQPVGAAE